METASRSIAARALGLPCGDAAGSGWPTASEGPRLQVEVCHSKPRVCSPNGQRRCPRTPRRQQSASSSREHRRPVRYRPRILLLGGMLADVRVEDQAALDMDPISLVVAAAALGASTGLKEAATSAVIPEGVGPVNPVVPVVDLFLGFFGFFVTRRERRRGPGSARRVDRGAAGGPGRRRRTAHAGERRRQNWWLRPLRKCRR
jgi:hypothetical protein